MLESDYEFLCPHCGVHLSIRLDPTGGRKQEFVQDCETCCRPIRISITLEQGQVSEFDAEQEP
jgi:hypothetical protein